MSTASERREVCPPPLAVVCGYSSRSGASAVSVRKVEEVLRRLAPAEAATHVPHPNIWSWRSLLQDATQEHQFVAFYLAHEHDQPSTPDEGQFLRLARPQPR